MATVTDTELTGRAFRVLRSIDSAGNTSWYKLSLWSRAADNFFADGKSAQTKLGSINGITSDINGTATDIAASIKVVRDVSLVANAAKTQSDANKTSLGGCNLSYENGKYYIQVGADTGTKKPLGSGLEGLQYAEWEFENNVDAYMAEMTEKRVVIKGKKCNGGSLGITYIDRTEEEKQANKQGDGSHDWYIYVTYDFYLKHLFPNADHANWTVSNFIFAITSMRSKNDSGQYTYFNWSEDIPKITYTYNPSTGVLSVGHIQTEHGEFFPDDDRDIYVSAGIEIKGFRLYIVN